MTFLLTGAAGFLGSHLANNLAREGHQVRGLDDLSAGDPQMLSPDVLFTRGDVNDRPRLWTLLQEVDCVYHLAARVLVPESVLYPREYNTTNVGGTVSLMEAMRDVGVRRVVFISSGAVYGTQAEQPVRETAFPNPRSPYAVSKLAAEYYARTIGDLWGTRPPACVPSTPMARGTRWLRTPRDPQFLAPGDARRYAGDACDGSQTRLCVCG
jgi:UDP-glucose 4-epimerase